MPGEVSVEHVAEVAGRLERALSKAMVGQRRVIREIPIAFLAGGHVLLRAVPGLATTLLIKTARRIRRPAVQPHPVHGVGIPDLSSLIVRP